VSLDSRPTDRDGGEALAREVAARADCTKLDIDGEGTGMWWFTCRKPKHTFYIMTRTSATKMEKDVADLQRQKTPYVLGKHYLVIAFATPDHAGDKASLHAFPGSKSP
jgi:hypothetical protein